MRTKGIVGLFRRNYVLCMIPMISGNLGFYQNLRRIKGMFMEYGVSAFFSMRIFKGFFFVLLRD
jgi:hypothetical protein